GLVMEITGLVGMKWKLPEENRNRPESLCAVFPVYNSGVIIKGLYDHINPTFCINIDRQNNIFSSCY
ncbi:hypothetical protein, partial [Moritella viscosa]